VNRASFALLATLVVALALGESPEPAKIRITTWNLEWKPEIIVTSPGQISAQ
jgi:hypothetical protein